MFRIERYTPAAKGEWDAFVRSSRNGTFLLLRDYMDYHADRFADHSLLFYQGSRLYALLPANQRGDVLFSHQGLTYGGLLTSARCTAAAMRQLLVQLNDYLRGQHIARVEYKAIPYIYHRLPAEEDLYALWTVSRARLKERDISSAIRLSDRLPFAESRKSGLRKAQRAGVTVSESDDLPAFWQILDDNLLTRHGVHPVHSLAEIQLLQRRFPSQIRLFMACVDRQPVGGTLLYLSDRVMHTQYISANPQGKAAGAIDMLFQHIINQLTWPQEWLDFGKSTEQNSDQLNEALIFQKEGFGARAVCYDTYEWPLH